MFKQLYALPLLSALALAGAAASANAAEKAHHRHRSVKHSAPRKDDEAAKKQDNADQHDVASKHDAGKKRDAAKKHDAPSKQDEPAHHVQAPAVPVQHDDPETAPAPAAGNEEVSLAGLPSPLWGTTAERRQWTGAVREVVAARLADFEKAKDRNEYCPGYDKATKSQRVNCWVMLVSAVSRFESNFVPGDSFRESDGNYSIGLLAMSPPQCPNAHTPKALTAAVPNLVCGVNYMAKLIAEDHYIDGPATGRGAAKNWSTLRAPYKVYDRSRHRNLNLGYKLKIEAMLKGYKGSLPAHVASDEQPVGAAGSKPNSIEDLLARDEAETIMTDRDGSEKDLSVNVDRDFYEPR